jgi:alpha-1,3-mannosylglycoprotein beta-1,4-N-acetylglucosaminyltransferase C
MNVCVANVCDFKVTNKLKNYACIQIFVQNKINKIKIITGSDDRQNDILHRGALEVGEKLVGTKKGKQCTSYITLGEFKNGHIEVQNVDHKIAFDIECVRIVVTASQKEWLIIRSISLWTTQPPSQ